MAAARFYFNQSLGTKAFDWVKILARTPASSKTEVAALRNSYLSVRAQLESIPEQPPKINWETYKSVIRTPAFVDSLKAKYDAIKVTYPADAVSSQINANEKTARENAAVLVATADKTIADYKRQLAAVKSEKAFEDITVDEYLNSNASLKKESEEKIAKNDLYMTV